MGDEEEDIRSVGAAEGEALAKGGVVDIWSMDNFGYLPQYFAVTFLLLLNCHGSYLHTGGYTLWWSSCDGVRLFLGVKVVASVKCTYFAILQVLKCAWARIYHDRRRPQLSLGIQSVHCVRGFLR